MVSHNGREPEDPASSDPARLVREEVERRSSPWTFQTYFADAVWMFEPPNRLSISVPNRERRFDLERTQRDRIQDAARTVLYREIELDIVEAQPERPARAGAKPLARTGSLPFTELTFETFVTGPQSRVAHAVALTIAERPGEDYNPVFICGPPGVGKTHLLHAICCRLREKASLEPLLLGSQEFCDRFTEAVSKKSLDDFRSSIREVRLLAVEDVHFLAGESTREELFRTIDDLVRRGRQVVLSCTTLAGDLGTVAARMRSRFPGRLTAFLAPPEIETRIEILRRLAARRNCDLPLDVAQLIASRMEGSVRELEGNLIQVFHTANNLHLPVDLVTAQLALDPLPAAPGVRRSLSVASITVAVAEHFLVKERDVTGPSQKRRIVLPRQIAMFLCRELTHRSLMDIGSQYGGRDHTTVMHSIRRVEDLARRDHRVQRDLAVLKARILSRA